MGRPRYQEFEQRVGERFEVHALRNGADDIWTLLECKLLDTPDLPEGVASEWFQLSFATEGHHEQGTFQLTACKGQWKVELFGVPEAEKRICVTFS